jgi:starch phosphorylase
VIPALEPGLPIFEQHKQDALNLIDILERQILPLYYQHPDRWLQMIKTSMQEIIPYFNSDRMAREYYDRLYKADIIINPDVEPVSRATEGALR